MYYVKKINDLILLENFNSRYLSRTEKLGILLHLYSSIPLPKEKSSVVISKIIKKSRPEGFFNIYDDKKIIIPYRELHDKLRFYDFFESLLSSKDTRGHNFEGLVAGLFGGELTTRGERSDVIINGERWSVKFLNDEFEYPSITSLKHTLMKWSEMDKRYSNILDIIIDKYNSSMYELFTSNNYKLKSEVYDLAFKDIDGFIISYPKDGDKIIMHVVLNKDMKKLVCSGNVVRPKNKSDNWSLRVNLKYKTSKPIIIMIPYITDEELDELLNYPAFEWAVKVFGEKIARKLRSDVIREIIKNREEIINNMKKYKFDINI